MKITKTISALATIALLSGCAMSQERYMAMKTAFEGSPKLRQKAVAECELHESKMSPKTIRNVALVANTTPDKMPYVICSRLMNGLVSGRLTYEDYRKTITSDVPPPAVIKVMQGR